MLEKILSSRYQIIQPIGQGGFGKTYLAKDIQLPGNPQCVVKQFHPSVSTPNFLEVARRLFNTEAETLQKLGTHDQIPLLLAHFEEEEEFYLVQQYIEGNTLAQELLSGQCWAEPRIIELMQDCLHILAFVHSQGVIHRDVKPDNLIRRQQDNKLVLVDFGTVKEIINANTQVVNSTVAVGTRGYMPTEQARGKPRITSDIYALGMIGIQAATGIHPMQFKEDENGELIWQSQAQASSELVNILTKMVRYHFKDRYQSAEEVSQELKSLSNSPLASSKNISREYIPTVVVGQTELSDAVTKENPLEAVTETKANAAEKINSPVADSFVTEPSVSTSPNNSDISTSSSSQIPISSSTSAKSQSQSVENSSENFFDRISTFIKSPTGKTLCFAIPIALIATGGLYFSNHQATIARQKEIETMIGNLEGKHNQKQYQECYQEAEKSETINAAKSAGVAEKMTELISKCRLGAAQKQASLLEYSEAIATAVQIPNNSPNYQEVQENIDSWSNKILENASEMYDKDGNLKEALKEIEQIPDTSGVKKVALDRSDEWKEDYDTNKTLIADAENALQAEKWQQATEEAKKVTGSSYWKEKSKSIIAQAEKALENQKSANQKPSVPVTTSTTTRTSIGISRGTSTGSTTSRSTSTRAQSNNVYTQPKKIQKATPKKPVVIDICPGLLCNE